jgi:phosphinothricin acetyltransferase
MTLVIRSAGVRDIAPMLAIYAPIVRDTAISFELEPPSLDEFAGRVAKVQEHAPWLVCDDDGILGYAYASKFRERPAYRFTVETTVYVRADARGKGVGRALYDGLFRQLRERGFVMALAVIALPNPRASRSTRPSASSPLACSTRSDSNSIAGTAPGGGNGTYRMAVS